MALTKIDDRGLNTPIDLLDNEKIRFGTGSDLQIYHDGSHSYINHSGTGNFYIYGNGVSDLVLRADPNKESIKCIHDAAVELYYDNVKTFSTDGNGIFAYGPEGGTANVYIYADEGDDDADKWSLTSGTDGTFTINNRASGSFEKNIECNGNGNVELYYDNSKKLETTSTGVSFSGDTFMPDSEYAHFGTGNDMYIGHDGTNSSITNTSVNDFNIFTAGDFYIKNTNAEKYIKCVANGKVELYHNNSPRLETTASGIHVSGNIDLSTGHIDFDDSHKARFGASSDLQIYHDGSNSFIDDSGTGNLILRTSQLTVEGAPTGGDALLTAVEGGACKLYYDGNPKLETKPGGIDYTGQLATGNNNKATWGNGDDLQIWHDGTNSTIFNNTGDLYIDNNQTNSNNVIVYSKAEFIAYVNISAYGLRCQNGGATTLYYDGNPKFATGPSYNLSTGDVSPSATNTYNLGGTAARWGTVYASNALDTSDRNEKNTIQPSDLGLGFINKLSPVSYKWNDTNLGNKTHYGLIAQDLEEVIISEGKTLDDFGGIEKPESDPMSLGYKELISPLIKAIQELSAEVEALKAK